MRFYVASKFENKEAVQEAIVRLTDLGHEVTHDWTRHESWDWNEPGATERLAPICAHKDVVGVMDADVFILLTYNEAPMVGALVELGVAISSLCYIYIVGPQPRNIFTFLPGVTRVETLEEVIETLEGIRV